MKQSKIMLVLFTSLYIFLLNGCNEGGSGSSGLNSASKEAGGLKDSANDVPTLTSFTLWGKQGDINTAIAGEILGSNKNDNNIQINIQIPAGTDVPSSFYVTYAGANLLKMNGLGNWVPVLNDSLQTFTSIQRYKVAGTDPSPVFYNIVVTPNNPNFVPFPDQSSTECMKDIDGNIWPSNPTKYPGVLGNWNSAIKYVNNFSACNFTTGEWSLPSVNQAKSIINIIPLAYRSSQAGGPGVQQNPSDWFKPQGITLPFLVDYWTNSEDGKGNASVMGIFRTGIYSMAENSSILGFWPIHSGDGSDFKTITDFSVGLKNGQSQTATIVGKQILVTTDVWIDPNTGETKVPLNFITTGGMVTINGVQYASGSVLTLYEPNSLPLQVIPVTVTSTNEEKNIYTLIIKFSGNPDLLPVFPVEPVFPVTFNLPLYLCTSSDSKDNSQAKYNRTAFVTIGSNGEYRVPLPEPGKCAPINFNAHPLRPVDLNVMRNSIMSFWSTTGTDALVTTNYFDADKVFHSGIPTFKWVPNSAEPSGYTLTAEVRTNCNYSIDPKTSNPEFSADCTKPNNIPSKTKPKSYQNNISIVFSSSGMDANTVIDDVPIGLVTKDWDYFLSNYAYLPEINQTKSILIDHNVFLLAQKIYQSGDGYSPLFLQFTAPWTIYRLTSEYSDLYTVPGIDGSWNPNVDRPIPPLQGLPLNMMAEMKYCVWNLDWYTSGIDRSIYTCVAAGIPRFDGCVYTSLHPITQACNFPSNPSD